MDVGDWGVDERMEDVKEWGSDCLLVGRTELMYEILIGMKPY